MANNVTGSIAAQALTDGVEDLLCSVEGLGALGIQYSWSTPVTADGTVRVRTMQLSNNKSRIITVRLAFCPTSKLTAIQNAIYLAFLAASPVRVNLAAESRSFDYACFLNAPVTTGEESDGQVADVTLQFIILGAWV